MTLEKNPNPENISGNFIFWSFFSLFELVIVPSILLQKVFIGMLNRSNSSIQSIPNKFCPFFITNAFNFLSFSLKETFMKVSPINFYLSGNTFCYFFELFSVGHFFFQVSALIIVKSDPVCIRNFFFFFIVETNLYIFSLYFFSCCLFSRELYPFFYFLNNFPLQVYSVRICVLCVSKCGIFCV